jgi:dihydroflavonol-4-reductase
MEILVTGASGLLGSAVVKMLAQERNQIRILIRPDSDIRTISNLVSQQNFGDITSYDSVYKAMQDCRAVVHVAAVTKQTGISSQEYERVNVGGTVNILNAAIERGNVRIVYVSTASTIKYGTRQNPGNELHDADEDFGSHYIKSKIAAEKKVLEAVRSKGANAVVMNPAFMIGPATHKASSGELLGFAGNHKILPTPPGGKNFIDVGDVAFCIAKALTRGKPGERYLVANENLSYGEFFKMIESAQGKQKKIIKIPRPLWRAAQNFLTFVEKGIGFSFGINSTMMKISDAETYYSGEKAKKEFGVFYNPINDTLKRVLSS